MSDVALYLTLPEAKVVADALGNIKTGEGTTVASMSLTSHVASAVLYDLRAKIAHEEAKGEQ